MEPLPMKSASTAIVLAASIFVAANAFADTNDRPISPQKHWSVEGDLRGGLTSTDWVQDGNARSASPVQMAKADRFDLSMKAQSDDVSRQLTSFVKKHKSSSEIGYPATAKVTHIQDYEVLAENASVYEVSIRYQVVASVDSATFEDIFIVKIDADGQLQIVEMKS
jgi:hypothetical protein